MSFATEYPEEYKKHMNPSVSYQTITVPLTKTPEMGYHLKEISKGTLGTPSKITEEYLEFMDACEQNNPLMQLQELSDLLGAIDAYVKQFNMSLESLLVMTKATERAFKSGRRK